jgi:serine-type D-Ala-D-Ala carboxypeptidase/endopeptidase (penicillin-binding protein 4)
VQEKLLKKKLVQSSELENIFHLKIKLKIKVYIVLSFACLFIFSTRSISQEQNKDQESSIQDLATSINQIISDPFFKQTTIALDIFDLTDSVSLFRKNEKLILRPASNMKLLTSVTALINLGTDYFFHTDLVHTGVIEGSKLYGDIFVVGGFDPDFTVTDLDSFVNDVSSLGINEISGGIYADISKKDSLYWGKGWMWDDDPDPSQPYLSSLNINNNSIEVFVESGAVDSPAFISLIPNTNYVKVINNSVTVSSNSSEDYYVTRDWVNRQNTILVEGKIRKISIIDSAEHITKLNLLNPEKYLLTLFKEKLESHGIKIDKPIGIEALPENAVYLTNIIRPIDSVLIDLNKESDNLNAEMLVYAIALNDSGTPASADNGLAAVKRFIDSLGLSSANYSIADGSGVSHYNLVSAELLNQLLIYMYYQRKDLFNLFYESLPIAGVDGTLKNRMKNTSAQDNVHAKTGTLNGVSNLSGYVTAKNGHLIAFSILIQNFVKEYSTARDFQNKICELLSDYK